MGSVNGKASITYKNGDSYQGGFRSNKYHGNGTYIYNSGEKISGKWSNGVKDDVKLNYPLLSEPDIESTIENNVEKRYHVHIPNLPIFPNSFKLESSNDEIL